MAKRQRTAANSSEVALAFDAGKPGDPRLGSLVTTLDGRPPQKTAVGLVWFPFDEGTLLNGGRGGSCDSPAAVARLLSKMGTAVNPEEQIDLASRVCLVDIGCAAGGSLDAAHTSLEGLAKKALDAGVVPVVVGGSNDQSFCNASAWLDSHPAARAGTVVNIDAHLDVRPLTADGRRHSGSPFFCLVEDARFTGRLVEFAAQGNQCSREHTDYVTGHGGQVQWLSELRRDPLGPVGAFQAMLDTTPAPIFVSFDVDSICSRDMPGVSCPSAVGLSADEALSIARAAGRNPNVDMLDISELNVAIEGDRSPRLVVNIIYSFLLGIAERTASVKKN